MAPKTVSIYRPKGPFRNPTGPQLYYLATISLMLILPFLILLALTASATELGFRPLLRGNPLSKDFIVDTPGIWTFERGVLKGTHTGLKYNDFLRTRRNYGDFILKAKFRLKDGAGNSGIQFRSKPVPDSHEVSGYQADMGQTYWGCLYDESRRKKILASPKEGQLVGLDKSGWNEYVVTANGKHITIELNGIRTVDYEEPERGIEETGFIAFQVHSGPGITVEFKDVRIRELKK